jgi:neutral ceramidase
MASTARGTQFVDPSLGVFKFETLSGELVALLLNYGIEPVVNEGQPGEISGDVPGAAARYVEESTGGKAVALFTIAPAASPAYRVWAKPVVDPRERRGRTGSWRHGHAAGRGSAGDGA